MIRLPPARNIACALPSDEDVSVFLSAAQTGDTKTITELLDCYGQNIVNVCNDNGDTALMFALDTVQVDAATILISRGADVNTKDNDGGTALMLAALGGYVAIVTALLDRGAEVNAASLTGDTALMWAASGGHTEIITILLDKGADADAIDNADDDAERWAVKFKHTKAEEILSQWSEKQRQLAEQRVRADVAIISTGINQPIRATPRLVLQKVR